MRCCGSNYDGEVAHGKLTHPMDGGDSGARVTLGDHPTYLAHGSQCRGVGRVIQFADVVTLIVIADDPDEERDAPAGGVSHGREDFVHRQRRVPKVAQDDGGIRAVRHYAP